MPVPKSIIKFKKGEMEYTSSVDRVKYTIEELTRGALRDCAKFVCSTFRKSYYSMFKKKTSRVGRFTQYWVRRRELDVQIGIKPMGFYGLFQEIGSHRQPKLGFLYNAVFGNIAKIIEIQSRYLSALEEESNALNLISQIDENDMEGGGDD